MSNVWFLRILISFAFCLSSPASAELMDQDTYALLITKLERVLDLMPVSNNKRVDLVLRLADLHAERARLEDLEQGQRDADKISQEAKNDRTRALELYQEALKNNAARDQGQIIFQMAQLYTLQNEEGKASGLFKKVVANQNKTYQAQFIGQALVQLGDLAFDKIQFDKAQNYYLKALNIKETKRRDYIKYRLAWCDFHKGHLQPATQGLTSVLRNPEDLNNESPALREEMSRDLATFMSRGHVGAAQVQTLSTLSPSDVRHQNLIYLSDELKRLGQKDAAVYVITVAGPDMDASSNGEKDAARDKIEEHLKLAELQYDIGKKTEVNKELKAMVDQWQAEPCALQENCHLLKDRFRALMINWGKAEENHPSPELIQAYGYYTNLIPDADMNYWAALAARKEKLYKEAAGFYRKASELAQNSKVPSPKKPTSLSLLEASLLGEIEVAELAGDSGMRSQAYDHYLSILPNGSKVSDVQYQKAHLLYEGAHYPEAALALHTFAISSGPLDLREKAAHLSLDSLVLAKSEEGMQSWATEYAGLFHKDRNQFIAIAKKAILNAVAMILNNPGSTTDQFVVARDKLKLFPVQSASLEEKKIYYKDQLILAEKLKDLGLGRNAALALLECPKLSESDRNYALTRLEWIAELTLNFKEAYKLSLQLPMNHLTAGERALKLAMLSELASLNPKKHYLDYMNVGHDQTKLQNVAVHIIELSKSEKDFFKYENYLRGNSDLLSSLALKIFYQHRDLNFAQRVLEKSSLRNAPMGRVLSRLIFINNFKKFSGELTQAHLSAGSKAQFRLQKYVSLLNRTEEQVRRAIQSQDWILQVVTLSEVAYHYKKFAVELFRINGNGDAIYREAQIYRAKSSQVALKLNELWNDSAAIGTLLTSYQKVSGDLRPALYMELRDVSRVAPQSKRSDFISALVRSQAMPSEGALEQARLDLRRNPFDEQKIERLKDIEEKRGAQTYVAFLAGRLSQVQGEKR